MTQKDSLLQAVEVSELRVWPETQSGLAKLIDLTAFRVKSDFGF